jgi:hypothetical protein
MILSDGWVLSNSVPPADPPTPPNFDPSLRNAHTHNITMNDGDVTRLANGGLQITGTATVTLNGGPTPFAQQSPLTVVITGGPAGEDNIRFSNITLTFGTPASMHFGSLPLPGVVSNISRDDSR